MPETHEPVLAVVAEVYAALVLLSLVGYSLNRALLELEQRLMPWYRRSA
jgi:ABC-type nitrate/sulfonate/bicarbonate transport system permease component